VTDLCRNLVATPTAPTDQSRATKGAKAAAERYGGLQKHFPNMLWLIRDEQFDLPSDCENVRDYLFRQVLTESYDDSSEVAVRRDGEIRLIKNSFRSHEAASLPCPVRTRTAVCVLSP
jgi:hypothetical protein